MTPLKNDPSDQYEPFLLGVADFFGSCDEKIEYLVEPFVPRESFVLVMGPPKSGKTWFAAWLATEVAQRGHRVVVVEEEGSKEILRDRLLPFVGEKPTHLNGVLAIAHREGVRLDNPRWIEKLVRGCEGASLVVMDPFVALHGQDENDQAELGHVLAAIQRIITWTGASVVLLHHTRKGASWESGGPIASAAEARGSSALTGNADSIICIRTAPERQRIEGQVRFVVENTGSRIAAPFERRTATVKLAGGPDVMTWKMEEETPPKEAKEKEVLGELLSRILEIVPMDANSPVSREKLREALRVSSNRLCEAVDLGIRHGVLAEIKRRGIYKTDPTPF